MNNNGISMERIKIKLGEKEMYILLLENTVAQQKAEIDQLYERLDGSIKDSE